MEIRDAALKAVQELLKKSSGKERECFQAIRAYLNGKPQMWEGKRQSDGLRCDCHQALVRLAVAVQLPGQSLTQKLAALQQLLGSSPLIKREEDFWDAGAPMPSEHERPF